MGQAGQRQCGGHGKSGKMAGEAGKHCGTPVGFGKPGFDSMNEVSIKQ
jgi:hypothetical protein